MITSGFLANGVKVNWRPNSRKSGNSRMIGRPGLYQSNYILMNQLVCLPKKLAVGRRLSCENATLNYSVCADWGGGVRGQRDVSNGARRDLELYVAGKGDGG